MRDSRVMHSTHLMHEHTRDDTHTTTHALRVRRDYPKEVRSSGSVWECGAGPSCMDVAWGRSCSCTTARSMQDPDTYRKQYKTLVHKQPIGEPRALLSRARHLDHASRSDSPWARPHYSACGFPRAQRPRTLANAPGTPRPTSHESPMDLNPLNGSGMRLAF